MLSIAGQALTRVGGRLLWSAAGCSVAEPPELVAAVRTLAARYAAASPEGS